jgi:adenine phosphoribosyltransferase
VQLRFCLNKSRTFRQRKSVQTVERLVTKAGGIVVAKAAILAEGDAAQRDDIIFLEKLPLFPLK